MDTLLGVFYAMSDELAGALSILSTRQQCIVLCTLCAILIVNNIRRNLKIWSKEQGQIQKMSMGNGGLGAWWKVMTAYRLIH